MASAQKAAEGRDTETQQRPARDWAGAWIQRHHVTPTSVAFSARGIRSESPDAHELGMLSPLPRRTDELGTITAKACEAPAASGHSSEFNTGRRRGFCRWRFHAFAVLLQGLLVWRRIGESMPPSTMPLSTTLLRSYF